MRGKILIGIAILFLFFCATYLSRNSFFEYDSYYFFSLACNNLSNFDQYSNYLDKFFTLFPCDDKIIKIFLLTCFGSTIFILWLFFKENSNNPEVALALSFVSPALAYGVLRFENDSIGIPLFFLALFFVTTKKWLKAGITIIIGLLFWKAFFLIPLAIGFNYSGILIFLLFIGLILFESLFLPNFFPHSEIVMLANILPRFDVAENFPLMGLLFLLLHFYWFPNELNFLTFIKHFKFNKYLIFFTILGIINMKFFIFAVPFICLLLSQTWDYLNIYEKKVIIMICFLSGFVFALTFSGLPYFESQPKSYEFIGVNDAIKLGETMKKPIVNDFAFGHMIRFYGGTTKWHSGPPNPTAKDINGAVVLSSQDFDCQVIKKYSDSWFGNSLRLYSC